MDVAALPAVVTGTQFTLTGTHDANDLTFLKFYHNPTAPSLTGATLLSNVAATFAAPHTYTVPINLTQPVTIAVGGTGYFIVTADVNAAGTSGNTVKIDGAVNPVTFSFTTSPPITNNQTDAAGAKTIVSTVPLSLIRFGGVLTNTGEAQLQWTTAQEVNTSNFEVEWSADGIQFSNIAVLRAAGNSSQFLEYRYTHKLPVDGNNYYRLRMNDKDGRFTYSPVIKLNVSIHSVAVAAFPNPVTDVLQLQVSANKNETVVFHLFGADGKIVASKAVTLVTGGNRFSWNLRAVAPGHYFIFGGNGQFEAIKIIKQ
jgi:hypothetical protein